MDFARYIQVIGVWVVTIIYLIGAYMMLIGGGVLTIIGVLFAVAGIAHVLKLFDGSMFKYGSH